MKTILFASLIAAMILPFSVMDFAVAEKPTFDADKIRSMLAEDKKQAKADKMVVKDQKALDKIDRKLERIDIFIKLTDIKEAINNEKDSKKIEKLESKAQKLLTKYENTVQPEDIELGSTENLSTNVSLVSFHIANDISFDALQVRNADCVNPNKTYSRHTGDGTSYFNKIVTDHWANYPSSIGIGGGLGGCDTKQGQYTEAKLNTSTATCWHFMWPVAGSWNDLTCNTIQAFEVVLVTTQAWYSGGNMFSPNYGWDIMVT